MLVAFLPLKKKWGLGLFAAAVCRIALVSLGVSGSAGERGLGQRGPSSHPPWVPDRGRLATSLSLGVLVSNMSMMTLSHGLLCKRNAIVQLKYLARNRRGWR